MPRRDDIHKILLLGSGPIVIGQAAEFDYSGTQACRVLVQEGYEVVLVNSNPATIMTDPEVATTTYIEPLLPGPVTQVIERERPDALLPTLGGQTALNLAKALHEDGTLAKYGVELIGADYEAIDKAEDRERFRDTMNEAGLRVPKSVIATTLTGRLRRAAPARAAVHRAPRVHARRHRRRRRPHRGRHRADRRRRPEGLADRPGPAGGVGARLGRVRARGDARPHRQRGHRLLDREPRPDGRAHRRQRLRGARSRPSPTSSTSALRDQAIAVIRAVGVETGGSNVQFAVNAETEEIVIIEMNPRVSRSSALASKATGFPIAKIAARLAVGYTLQEIPNDITKATPASFEPAIDYCVVKWPRFAFEKFPGRRGGADHAHEVGRRGDGARAHVQAGLCQGAALTRARHPPDLPAG